MSDEKNKVRPTDPRDIVIPDVSQDAITTLGQELNAERAREASQVYRTIQPTRPGLKSPIGFAHAPLKDQETPPPIGRPEDELDREGKADLEAAREAYESHLPKQEGE